MSSMVLDKSLDSIIAEKKKTQRRPHTRAAAHSAKAKLVGKGGTPVVAARKKAAAAGAASSATPAVASSATTAVKIIVSNLPTDVNEAQIKDLFYSTVGPTRSCVLQYNAAGKSSGVATVLFSKQGDAQKAFDTYNNRLIDGKRPMKIEIVYDPAKQPLVNRVAAAAKPAATSTVAAAGGGGAPARGGRPRRGRGGRAGGKRPAKTAEDLDQEMADYTKEATTTVAA